MADQLNIVFVSWFTLHREQVALHREQVVLALCSQSERNLVRRFFVVIHWDGNLAIKALLIKKRLYTADCIPYT